MLVSWFGVSSIMVLIWLNCSQDLMWLHTSELSHDECSFILLYKQRSVFPIYRALQPGHVNSYTTELLYLIGVGSLSEVKQLESILFQLIMNLHGDFSIRELLCVRKIGLV